MEFDIDSDGTVRADGTPAPECEAIEDILNISGISIVEKPVIYSEADPVTGAKASVFQQTEITYAGTTYLVADTATRDELTAEDVEEGFRQGTPRRLIVSYQPVAGYLVTEKVPAAIESSFARGVFITIPPFD